MPHSCFYLDDFWLENWGKKHGNAKWDEENVWEFGNSGIWNLGGMGAEIPSQSKGMASSHYPRLSQQFQG